jgi:hypothetical protein
LKRSRIPKRIKQIFKLVPLGPGGTQHGAQSGFHDLPVFDSNSLDCPQRIQGLSDACGQSMVADKAAESDHRSFHSVLQAPAHLNQLPR